MRKVHTQIHTQLRDMGCCVSKFVYGYDNTPAEIHHITEAGRRLGHQWVIPLSPMIHRQGTAQFPSRHSVNGGHGGKAAFIAAYGYTEYELLAMCERYLDWKYSEEG